MQHDGRRVPVEHLAQKEDVADGLGHLLATGADHAVVHPDARERQAGGLALGDLVLVMREDEVAPAAVDVEAGSEVAQAHGRALDVPAGAAHAPRALPGGLPGLGRLPDREVERVLLAGLALDPCTLLELLDTLAGEPAVPGEAAHAEVHAPLGLVGVARRHELAAEVDDLGDRLGGERLDVRAQVGAQAPHVLVIGDGELLATSAAVRPSAFALAMILSSTSVMFSTRVTS